MPDSSESPRRKFIVLRMPRWRWPHLIAVGASSLLFMCAGCCFLTSVLLRSQLIETPEGVDEVAARVVDWTLPPGFKGKSAIKFDVTAVQFFMAKFQQEQGRGWLVIGQMRSSLPHQPDLKSLSDLIHNFAPELRMINVTEKVERTIDVRGFSAKFEIGEGEDRASTTKYRQVIGQFRSHGDDALLILQCEDGVLSDQQIDEFLQSIK